ncbi:hypothetical protein, partial [Exercitatus varius]
KDMGVLNTSIVNTAVEATDSFFRKNESVENTIVSSGSAFLTTAVGGFIGKKTENLLDTKYNPVSNKYKFETIYIPYPIEIQKSKSVMPSIFGNAANNSGALGFQIYLKSKLEELKK